MDFTKEEIELIRIALLEYQADLSKVSFAFGGEIEGITNLIDKIETTKVVKGNWIPSHPTTPAKEWKCTACQGLVYLPVFSNECYYNYCPNCGSRNR